jgi:peptidoglycan-associated lipoprotein
MLKPLSLAVALTAFSVLSGCHHKVAAVNTPPPAPAELPAPPQPTATLTADPQVIDKGQSTTLTWHTTGATEESISGIGTVSSTASQAVTPTSSTTYTLTAKGPGGSVQASAEVTVNRTQSATVMEPSLTEQQLFARDVKDIYFDYDRYVIESSDSATVDQDAAFLKRYPNTNIVIGGHCDERGSEEYNLALGDNRAQALKTALVADGVPASRIKTISYGKEKPFCTEEDESCWHQNRVDHVERAH